MDFGATAGVDVALAVVLVVVVLVVAAVVDAVVLVVPWESTLITLLRREAMVKVAEAKSEAKPVSLSFSLAELLSAVGALVTGVEADRAVAAVLSVVDEDVVVLVDVLPISVSNSF